MKHRIPAALLSAVLLTGQVLYLPSPAVTELTASADLEEGMGQIGDNVFWNYDFNDTLTIYGNGEISQNTNFPWLGTDRQITRIIIENGVTNLPDSIFQGLVTVAEVEIADTVTSIGANASAGCSNLSGITLPDALATLSGTAFDNTGLRRICTASLVYTA